MNEQPTDDDCPSAQPATHKPRYCLDDLLARCDPSVEISEEDQVWLNNKPVGSELL
jgi:antitoxin ChpS